MVMKINNFVHWFVMLNVHVCICFQEYRIGGLFHDDDREIAFRLATNIANTNYPETYFKLVADTSDIDHRNTFEVSRKTCSLFKRGIIGLFGPSSLYSSSYIQSICDRKEIPHIETNSNPTLDRSNSLVNLHPAPSKLVEVFIDLINAYKWHKMTILYENNESLVKIHKILYLNGDNGRTVSLRQLECDISGNYRPMLYGVKNSGETKFILDCSLTVMQEVLMQAQQVGLMTEKYSFIVTNLDLQTVDLSPFQYAGTNITGVRMTNPENENVLKIATEIQMIRQANGKPVEALGNIAAWKLQIETALTVDAVLLFYETISDLTRSNTVNLSNKPIHCNMTDNWQSGYTIINYMKRKTMGGITGLIRFDNEGFRSDFTLELVELTIGGIIQIGTWNSTSGLNITKVVVIDPTIRDEGSFVNKTFVVITCLTPPYGMLKETTTQLTGNDRFEGLSIDLIKDLANMLGFNYTFIIQEDGANGNYDHRNHQWDGMIREIIDGRADLAITDLTITSERESGVDFTMPFMNLGISILYRKPEPVPPSLFMFASPFSLTVWSMLGVTYLLVSLLIFIMGRLSPNEWDNPFPCVEEPEYLVNQFTIKNCFWFTIGSLMQQGSDLEPRSISTRTASGVWWFFTLIMVSTYTANLAAFLTVETLVTSFGGIEGLADQTEIKFGAKHGGATINFFRDSNVSSHKKIWNFMKEHPEEMPKDNDEAVARVELENYAYLMESTSIEYVVERHCTLARVGRLLDDKGYGIAMKKNSPYRNDLSTAVLKLQESGRLSDLKIKWWKEKRGGGKCASKSEGGEATPLDLKNVGGVFLVLFIGTVVAIISTFIELFINLLKRSKICKSSLKEEFKKELKFFIHFKQNVKIIDDN